MTARPEFIVISGLSGSGKSTAVKVFEDMGSYCVDNLPTPLLPKMLDLFGETTMDLKLVVLGMDIREQSFMEIFPRLFREIRERGVPMSLLFFTANEEVLVRRYSESRRVHPLGGKGTLIDAIRREREKMNPLRELADEVIDTSAMSLRDLREEVLRIGRKSREEQSFSITLQSFGYKYGIPFDTDLVFDVRFLPNPFFVEALRHRTGLDDGVRDFVLSRPETGEFMEEFKRFLTFILPRYRSDGRSYLTVGIGCTGGRHRSVVVTRAAADHLESLGYSVSLRDRDIHGE